MSWNKLKSICNIIELGIWNIQLVLYYIILKIKFNRSLWHKLKYNRIIIVKNTNEIFFSLNFYIYFYTTFFSQPTFVLFHPAWLHPCINSRLIFYVFSMSSLSLLPYFPILLITLLCFSHNLEFEIIIDGRDALIEKKSFWALTYRQR